MSFLSKLREQQSQQCGTRLCYLCTTSSVGRLRLRLELCRLDTDGAILELIQAYSPQPAHLSQLPPYMNSTDQQVLRCFFENNPARGVSPPVSAMESDYPTWQMVIASGKCFINIDSAWRKLAFDGEYTAQMRWVTGPEGRQHLQWHCPSGYLLVLLGDQTAALDLAKGRLICAGGKDFLRHKHLVLEQQALEPDEVASFLESYREEWSRLGLPLPKALPIDTEPAQLRVHIQCFGHQMALHYRYLGDSLCLSSTTNTIEHTAAMFTGDRVVQLKVPTAYHEQVSIAIERALQGFERDDSGVFSSCDSTLWRKLLIDNRSALEALGITIEFAAGFEYHYVSPKDWRMESKASGPEYWNMQLDFELDGTRVKVLDLLRQLKRVSRDPKQNVLEIEYQQFKIILSEGLFEGLSSELQGLANTVSDAKLPLAELQCLKAVKELIGDEVQWRGDPALMHKALQLHASPIMLDVNSAGVQANLRSYQWLGVCWLQHMRHLGFNALLADDMGLGKTLQTLANLSLEYRHVTDDDKGRKPPSLIVAPTSLLSNWSSEVKKFCPHLNVQIVHGSQRHALWPELNECELLVTSYALILRDLERWQNVELHYLVLDEAQAIKNPQGKVTKAVKALNANHKLCLSGTPVENHLGELWSLFDFLEPGFLGSQAQFRECYRKPIEQDMDSQCFERLLKKIEPFMLRRSKSQVADDLPDKTVIQRLVTLDDEQMAFYESIKSSQINDVQKELGTSDNLGEQKLLLLTALMRLRQACCDPKLLEQSYPEAEGVASAKTEYCIEMLQALADEGRFVLVFSQFTSMLDILSQKLDELNLSHLMLTGKSTNRSQLVNAFQCGESPIFLISLKAGGVGLNLTRADTVIHFDPWWNQAAEDQASDRAHRIGQDKAVFVYKLIAEGTIEEKVARLQESKSQLSQPVARQAQVSGDAFALELEELLELC